MKAYKVVMEYEKNRGRTVNTEFYEKDGYDLKSKSLEEERHIEVKGSESDTISWRWLEQKQYDNIQSDPNFYLYFVKNVNSDKPEVLELPAAKLKQITPKVLMHYAYSKQQIEENGNWVAVDLSPTPLKI